MSVNVFRVTLFSGKDFSIYNFVDISEIDNSQVILCCYRLDEANAKVAKGYSIR